MYFNWQRIALIYLCTSGAGFNAESYNLTELFIQATQYARMVHEKNQNQNPV
jgi:hypothetical protein